jgi:hypothetical protein
MNKLVLKNDRLDSATWFVTAGVFAIVGLGALAGLIVANIRDPKALWMGPSVKYPQVIYLVFDGFLTLVILAMAGLAIFKGKRFFDRSVQLIIDSEGIQDFRGKGRKLGWADITEIKDWAIYSGAIATAAQLKVTTKKGKTIGIDVLGLDQDHKAIFQAVKQMVKRAARS